MEREKYAETSSKAIENILKLNKKSWKLYVPLHKKQQLQEQSACCIGIQALLSALGINFEVTERQNAEWMSKNGQVPLLIGNNGSKDIFSGWRKITEALETNEIVLCPEENRKEQKELFKMMDIIERVELYHSWCDPTTVGNVTKERYTKSLDAQFFAKYFIFKARQDQVHSYLQIYNWHKLKPKEVMGRFREILSVFSTQLGNKKYLLGNRISEIDCLLFGHLYVILTTQYFSVLGPKLADIVHEFQNLVDLTSLIDREIFHN